MGFKKIIMKPHTLVFASLLGYHSSFNDIEVWDSLAKIHLRDGFTSSLLRASEKKVPFKNRSLAWALLPAVVLKKPEPYRVLEAAEKQ